MSKNKGNTLKETYDSREQRDTQKVNQLLTQTLNSNYYQNFQDELECFFDNINLSKEDFPSNDICADIFAKIQNGKNRTVDALLRLLSNRLKKNQKGPRTKKLICLLKK